MTTYLIERASASYYDLDPAFEAPHDRAYRGKLDGMTEEDWLIDLSSLEELEALAGHHNTGMGEGAPSEGIILKPDRGMFRITIYDYYVE